MTVDSSDRIAPLASKSTFSFLSTPICDGPHNNSIVFFISDQKFGVCCITTSVGFGSSRAKRELRESLIINNFLVIFVFVFCSFDGLRFCSQYAGIRGQFI